MEKELYNVLQEHRKIYIFGCSNIGKRIIEEIHAKDIEYDCTFLDNSKEKQGTIFCGIEVKSVEDEQKELKNGKSIIILASVRFYADMEKQLKQLGVHQNRIIYADEVVREDNKKLKERLARLTPQEKLVFVVDIVEHCNLNCVSCDHFSPLSKEVYLPINEFQNDICRMAEIMQGKIQCVCLEGGEPLLNPDVHRYIQIVGEQLPNVEIQIFTNGILLKKMKSVFWDMCRKYKAVLEVTKYPISFDFKAIEDEAKRNGVKLVYFGGGNAVKKSMYKPIDLDGMQDKWDSFINCYMANDICVDLKHGRLYPCTFLANLHIFNEKFKQDLNISSDDYIDIYKDITSVEVFDFLCRPNPACRYCKVQEWTSDNAWKISKKQIEEWV